MAQILSKSSALATSTLHSRVQEQKPREGESTPTNSESPELHPDSPSDNFMSKERVREGNELMILEEEKAASPINRMYLNDFYGNTESPSSSIYNQSGRAVMPFLKLHQVENGESPQKGAPSEEIEGKAQVHTQRNEANDPGMLKTQQMNMSKYMKSSQELQKPTEVNNYMTPGESSQGSSVISKLNLKNLSSNFKLFSSKFSKTSKH
mmetsp:Transcript_22769/g.35059  ORF Transcript_22769/g.35059 Transcript_22769/m.35059 type:complete len:208 (-) Transcript_22769:368-991(-)